MKIFKYILVGLTFSILTIGCSSGAEEGIGENTEQSFVVVNSASSTNRIVQLYADVQGGVIGSLGIGDGIHKGQSLDFTVAEEECDKDWEVNVVYNDTAQTECRQYKHIKCGTTVVFTFDNTTCK